MSSDHEPTTAEAVRLLTTLLRCDERRLAMFEAMTGAAATFEREDLVRMRVVALQLATWLARDDPEGWREWSMSAGASTSAAGRPSASSQQPTPPGTGPVISRPPSPRATPAARSELNLPGPGNRELGPSTEFLDPGLAAEIAALQPTPFEGSAPAPPPARHEPDSMKGETAAVDHALVADVLASYPTAAPAALPMSIERYAAVVACTENASPEEAARVHAQYGIADAVNRRHIDEMFRNHFATDGGAKRQFETHLEQWRAWRRGG